LHYHKELAVICSRIEYLYHIRMIHGRGNTRLLLQSSPMIFFSAEISAQQLQRYEPIQLHVARLINGAHSANTKRLDYNEMIEASFYADLLAAVWTGDASQWLCLCRIDSRPATGACLGGGLTRHWTAILTFRTSRSKRSILIPAVELAGASPADSQAAIVRSTVRHAEFRTRGTRSSVYEAS